MGVDRPHVAAEGINVLVAEAASKLAEDGGIAWAEKPASALLVLNF